MDFGKLGSLTQGLQANLKQGLQVVKSGVTQVAQQLKKDKDRPDDREPETWGDEEEGERLTGDSQKRGALLVRYFLQNDYPPSADIGGFARVPVPDQTENAFAVQDRAAESLTLGVVRGAFPMKAQAGTSFHFRFKLPLQSADGPSSASASAQDFCWLDLAADSDRVPLYRGAVQMKVLCLPVDADTHVASPAQAAPGGASESPRGYQPPVVTPAAPQPQSSLPSSGSQQRIAPSSNGPAAQAPPPVAVRPPASAAPQSSSNLSPQRPPGPVPQQPAAGPGSRPASPAPQVAQTPPPQPQRPPAAAAPAGPPGDLMDFTPKDLLPEPVKRPQPVIITAEMVAARAAAVAQSSSQPASPLPTREELVAKREAEKNARVAQIAQEHEERQKAEKERMEARVAATDKLNEALDRWAKNPDGTLKDVRTLLSTLETALWEGHEWQPVSLATLLDQSSLKKAFRKCVIMCHPDKHQKASAEQQYRADRIFAAVNEAFKTAN